MSRGWPGRLRGVVVMDLDQFALGILSRRMLAIRVEPEDQARTPYVLSGFVVNFCEHWFWITAAHCSQIIEELVETNEPADLAFVSFSGGTHTTSLERQDCNFVDGQESLRSYARDHPDLGITDDQIKFFDVAIMPIPDQLQFELMNLGVKPFANEDVLPGEETITECMDKEGKALFACGIPKGTYELDRAKATFGFTVSLLPLHPDPDEDDSSVVDKRVISSEGFFRWIPTCWDQGQWVGTLGGVSGGPTVLVSDGRLLLVGVTTRERPEGDPEYLGVCAPTSFLTVLRDYVNDKNACHGQAR